MSENRGESSPADELRRRIQEAAHEARVDARVGAQRGDELGEDLQGDLQVSRGQLGAWDARKLPPVRNERAIWLRARCQPSLRSPEKSALPIVVWL